jgi:hypothetical protein
MTCLPLLKRAKIAGVKLKLMMMLKFIRYEGEHHRQINFEKIPTNVGDDARKTYSL